MRLHNFCAGPGVMPLRVLEEMRDELPWMDGLGASALEVSHRSSYYAGVEERAKAAILRLLGANPSEWTVLFLQGGASQQFFQVPMNLLGPGERAGYVVSGVWAEKAYEEARRFGAVEVVGTSEAEGHAVIPDVVGETSGMPYVHYCTNNTIYGTQWPSEPKVSEGVRLVADASSDFLSRGMSLDAHGLVYAGAQKNLGPAGVTVVMVRREWSGERRPHVPTLLDYSVHAAGLYHTPPVYAVYVVEKVLRWIEDEGGLVEMERRANARSSLLYGMLDGSAFWEPHAWEGSRSRMNVTFRLRERSLEAELVREAREAGFLELAGHRAVGGLRVSMYNACALSSVEALVSFLHEFERRRG